MSCKYTLAVEEVSLTLGTSPSAVTPEHTSVSMLALSREISEVAEAAAEAQLKCNIEPLQLQVDEKEKRPTSTGGADGSGGGGSSFLQVGGAVKHALKTHSSPRLGGQTKSASGSASESRNTSVSSPKPRKISYAGKQNSKDSVTFELSSCHISKFDESSVQSVFQRESNRKCSTGTLRSAPFLDKSRRSDSNASAAQSPAERFSISSGSAALRANVPLAGASSRQSIRGPQDDRIEEERASEGEHENADNDAEMQRAAARVRLKSRCRALWWKFFGWLSGILLFFAGVGIALGTLVPRRQIRSGARDPLDREAVEYNYSWDLLRVAGAIFLGVGLLSLAGR